MRGEAYDESVDVYSFGLVLCHMACQVKKKCFNEMSLSHALPLTSFFLQGNLLEFISNRYRASKAARGRQGSVIMLQKFTTFGLLLTTHPRPTVLFISP